MSAEHNEAEGRSAGSIPGVTSTAQERTYPTIEIRGGIPGEVATIIASCVTVDDYRPHPHSLVGRECKRGVFAWRERITSEHHVFQFRNLGIQCAKVSRVRQELERRHILHLQLQRDQLSVDPYGKGFSHGNRLRENDLKAVRLAFQVFLNRPGGRVALPPVLTDIIYDTKFLPSLRICRLSHGSGTVHGGTDMILLCEKIILSHVTVIFYEVDTSGQVVWEATAKIDSVHKQVAIVMQIPAYDGPNLNRPTHDAIPVHICLYRSLDNRKSEPRDFEYINDFKRRKYIMPELLDVSSLPSLLPSQPGPSRHQPSQSGASRHQPSQPEPSRRHLPQPGPSRLQAGSLRILYPRHEPSRIPDSQTKVCREDVRADKLLTHNASLEPTEPTILKPSQINQEKQEPLPSIATLNLPTHSYQENPSSFRCVETHHQESVPAPSSTSSETSDTWRRASLSYDEAILLRTSPLDELLESLRSNSNLNSVSSYDHSNQEPHDERNTPDTSPGTSITCINDIVLDYDFEC